MASLGQNYIFTTQTLIAIINALRECGTEEILKLPKIVIMGNQSAGKSSVIEAISEIKVPRAAGTCTRCPMEVILRRGEKSTWRGKVSLRIENSEVSGQVLQTIPFDETTSRAEVTLLLRRAQLAILNPSMEVSTFIDLPETQLKDQPREKSFSSNIIVLDIIGAPVDVTFMDLPGIIQSTAEPEEMSCVQMIKDLAAFYVKQKESLILVAITMKDDIDNQQAYSIAREFDPIGKRTIGVLTKPDMAGGDAEAAVWLGVMNNKSHKLQHGYYMVRLPKDEAEMQFSPEKARETEMNYLNGRWKNLLGEGVDPKKLGIARLSEELSIRLSLMIREILPSLKKDLLEKMRGVREGLDGIPKSYSDNPQSRLMSLCQVFIKKIEEYTSGKPNDDPDQLNFLQDASTHYQTLKDEVLSTRPRFDICADLPSTLPVGDYPPPLAGVAEGSNRIRLDEVRKKIQGMSKRELPGITPFRVHEHFIGSFIRKWQDICISIFNEVEGILKSVVDAACKEQFGTAISDAANSSDVISTILENAATRTRKEIQDYCRMESHRPFTLNEDYSNMRGEWRTSYAVKRRSNSCGEPSPSFRLTDSQGNGRDFAASEENLCTVLSAYGIRVSSISQLARIHFDDYDAELDVISHVTAYFDISSKRLIDDIPKLFESIFAFEFGKELERHLAEKLQLVGDGGSENCKRYIQDDPDVQYKRDELIRQQEILKNALMTVDRFHKGGSH